MCSPRDERLKDFRSMRERVRRTPENFAASLGELHAFLRDVYEAAARADENAEGFAASLLHVCSRRGLARWEDLVGEDQQHRFFKDRHDPLAQRVVEFWAELDDPLSF